MIIPIKETPSDNSRVESNCTYSESSIVDEHDQWLFVQLENVSHPLLVAIGVIFCQGNVLQVDESHSARLARYSRDFTAATERLVRVAISIWE